MRNAMSPLSLQMWNYICAWRNECGEDFGGWDILRDGGDRILVIRDRDGCWHEAVAMDWGDTFHHSNSPYYVGSKLEHEHEETHCLYCDKPLPAKGLEKNYCNTDCAWNDGERWERDRRDDMSRYYEV